MATHSSAFGAAGSKSGGSATARRNTSILGSGAALEALDQDDVGVGEVAAREADRIVLVGGALEEHAQLGASTSSTRSARPSWKWRQLSVPGLVHLGRVVRRA